MQAHLKMMYPATVEVSHALVALSSTDVNFNGFGFHSYA
jgi:hypothetical protein